MFYKIKLFYFFIFIIISIKFSNSYIIIPFKSTNPNYNLTYDNSSDFISKFKKELNKNKLYTKIQIGKEKKDAIFYLTMNDYFGLLKNSCPKGVISSYNPYESKSFTYDPESACTFYDLYNAKLGNDYISFYEYQQMNKYVMVNSLILVDNQSYIKREGYELDSYCGKIGLIVRSYYPYYYANLISDLKKNDVIKSFQWGIFFFDKELSYNIKKEIQNNYEGFFIAGLTESDYVDIFNTDLIYNTYTELPIYTMLGGKFDKIYFKYSGNKINCSENIEFEVDIEKNYITCTKDYYDNIKKYFFNKYFESNICKEIISNDKYDRGDSMIICNLTIKNELKNFPNLCLLYKELNFTFNLDYKELFTEINNKIYFLIISPARINLGWNFGNILIKKYSFMFDQDKKQIYFIHLKKYEMETEDDGNGNNEINEDNNNFKKDYRVFIFLSVLIIFIIIAAIIGFIFGRKIWEKHRKRKAYELDDNYDYTKDNYNENFSSIIN